MLFSLSFQSLLKRIILTFLHDFQKKKIYTGVYCFLPSASYFSGNLIKKLDYCADIIDLLLPWIVISFPPVCILIFHSDISCNNQHIQKEQRQSTVDHPATTFLEHHKCSPILPITQTSDWMPSSILPIF